MIEHYEVYCDGRVIYKVEGPLEHPFPFNMALDVAMKHLETQPHGSFAAILTEDHVLVGVAVHNSYTPCPWVLNQKLKNDILGGDGG